MKKLTIILLAAAPVIFSNCGDKNTKKVTVKTDSIHTVKDSALAADSSKNKPLATGGDDGEEGPYYPEQIWIGNNIPTKSGALSKTFKFGDKLYKDEVKSTENTIVFYTADPLKVSDAVPYSADANYLIDASDYDEYQKYFALPAFAALPAGVKKLILEKDYDNGNQYATTQNEERSKNVIAQGDYDADGIRDVAVVLDNNEKQISRLLVICTNKATKRPYLAYAENYNDKLKVNSFLPGSKVYMNSEDFVPAPVSGVILKGEDVKLALLYDKQLQKFKSYYQEAAAATAVDE